MVNKEKRPAETETLTGTCTMTFPDYNMFTPEEQEKAMKIMELFWMGLQVNGLNSRKAEITGTLPTMFFRFYGHVSNIDFDCHMTGYREGYDPDNLNEYQQRSVWAAEKEKFFEDADSVKRWLHGILEGMKHDRV